MTRISLHDRLLAVSSLLFLGLFTSGLALADLFANTAFPPPSATLDDIAAYFSQNGGAVRGLSVCHAFAALTLLIFGAYLSHRIQRRQPSALGAIALVSGGVAGRFSCSMPRSSGCSPCPMSQATKRC